MGQFVMIMTLSLIGISYVRYLICEVILLLLFFSYETVFVWETENVTRASNITTNKSNN